MTDLITTQPTSPFDSIRRVDDQGEHWMARDLMPVMGYSVWRDFAKAVERAKLACANSGVEPARNFAGARKVSASGPDAADCRLSRYGAYLVAMNGDPRKPEIAAAQTYFAVKTREAETAPRQQFAIPQTYAEALRLAADQATEIEAQAARLAIAEPKAEYVDGFVNPEDASLIRVFANQVGVKEKALRDWMVARKLIYRREVEQRWSRSQQRMVPVYQWLPYADHSAWFQVVDQPTAPRMHNGQLPTTLYVTPAGKVAIRRLLMKHPIAETPAA